MNFEDENHKKGKWKAFEDENDTKRLLKNNDKRKNNDTKR